MENEPDKTECPDDVGEDQKSSGDANKQKEEDVAETALLEVCMMTTPSPQSTIIKKVKEMFLRLGLSQTVATKLVNDQMMDSPWTLTSQ